MDNEDNMVPKVNESRRLDLGGLTKASIGKPAFFGAYDEDLDIVLTKYFTRCLRCAPWPWRRRDIPYQ